MQIKALPIFIISGITMIGSGFLGGMGGDVWLFVKTAVLEQKTDQSLSFGPDELSSYGLAIAGIILLSWAIYKYDADKNRERKKPEEKLNDLIAEIKKFIANWNLGIPLLTSSYRKQLITKTVYPITPEKLHNHSRKIKIKIAVVKEIKKSKTWPVLNSLTKLSNDIEKLSLDVDSTIMTSRHEREALQKNPNVFEDFAKTGDKICDDFKPLLLELEALLTDVL